MEPPGQLSDAPQPEDDDGEAGMKRDTVDKEFWDWWDSLSDYEKDQEIGR